MSDEKTTADVVEETTETEVKVEEKKEELKEETPKAEEKKEEIKEEPKKEVKVPKEFKAIVDAVEKMTVLELNSLVKVIEEKWGVSATAAVAPVAAGAGEAEKSEFTVVLESDGGAKIPVMKAVKELLGLGLKDAKELVESAPVTIKENAKKDEAEEIKAKIEEAGGTVELK